MTYQGRHDGDAIRGDLTEQYILSKLRILGIFQVGHTTSHSVFVLGICVAELIVDRYTG